MTRKISNPLWAAATHYAVYEQDKAHRLYMNLCNAVRAGKMPADMSFNDALDYLVDTEGRRGVPVSEQGQPIIGEFAWSIGAYRIVIYNYQTFCTYAAWLDDALICGDRVTSLFVALSVCVDAIGKHMAQAVQA